MKYTFGFIGCGNMGGALLEAVAKKNEDINIAVTSSKTNKEIKIAAYDKLTSKAQVFADKYDNVTVTDIKELCENSEYIFLGVKPQMIAELFDEIKRYLSGSCVLISMLAGTKINKICSLAEKEMPVIRIMPNTPALIGEGIILYCSNNKVKEEQIEYFTDAMSKAGLLDKIEESKIDAASAVSGCGPAFVYMFIEALADGAVECGVPRDKALTYAAKMVSGAAEMVLETKKHPGELKDAVCSPGGTTIAGVHALEDNGFRSAAMNAVTSAYKRTLELK